MATPVVSTNILPLRSPFRLHGVLQLTLTALLLLIGLKSWPEFHQNLTSVIAAFEAGQSEPEPALFFRTLVQAFGYLLGAWLVLRHGIGGLQRLLSFFIPVGVPGELGQATDTCRQLFIDRVFGHFDKRTSLADKVLVRFAPRLMYLTTPGMALLRAASSWGVLFWCALAFLIVWPMQPHQAWPWGVLAVAAVAKLIYAACLFLLTPPQPQLQVTEDRQHFESTGNPVNFFNHLERLATDLRHKTFPNRVYHRAEPDITNVQPNVTSTFRGGYLFETQPLPVSRAGSLPAFALGCAGVLVTFAGMAMLLLVPEIEPAPQPPAWIAGWCLAAITAIAYGGRFFSRALGLLQVFRFESHLFWIDLKGSFTSSAIGVGDGRGGQFFAERRSIQSDTYVTAFGAKVITEASGPNALRAPRIIIDTTTDEAFTTAFAQLLGGMPTFKDSTSSLPTIAFEKPGVKEILQANLAVNEGMARATTQGSLTAGARPAAELPPAAPSRQPSASDEDETAATPPPLPAAAADAGEMKTCPECGEQIRAVARKCRFCNYRFDGSPTA